MEKKIDIVLGGGEWKVKRKTIWRQKCEVSQNVWPGVYM